MEDYHGLNVPQGFALDFWFEFVFAYTLQIVFDAEQ